MHLSCTEDQYVILNFDFLEKKELDYLVRYYQLVVPKKQPVYKRYEVSILNITLTNFISHLKSYSSCTGITAPDSQQAISMTKHVISKIFNFIEYQNLQLFYFLSNTCEVLLPDEKQYAKIAML